MDTEKLKVLRALTEFLEGIDQQEVVAYDNTLRGKIFRGQSYFGIEVELPFVSILEAPRPNAGIAVGYDKGTEKMPWTVLLQGFAKDDVDNPTDPAAKLLGDVRHRLKMLTATNDYGEPKYPEHYLLGDLINDLQLLDGIVSPSRKDVSDTSFFYQPIIIELVRED